MLSGNARFRMVLTTTPWQHREEELTMDEVSFYDATP
jgi:hypothetical protein